jgi:hypothetical protein
MVLPFQAIEHIASEKREKSRRKPRFLIIGRQIKGWSKKIIWGDNKLILSSLKTVLAQADEAEGGMS